MFFYAMWLVGVQELSMCFGENCSIIAVKDK